MNWKGQEKNAGYGTDLERQRDKQRAENGTIGPTIVHSLVHGDGSMSTTAQKGGLLTKSDENQQQQNCGLRISWTECTVQTKIF